MEKKMTLARPHQLANKSRNSAKDMGLSNVAFNRQRRGRESGAAASYAS